MERNFILVTLLHLDLDLILIVHSKYEYIDACKSCEIFIHIFVSTPKLRKINLYYMIVASKL